MVGPGSSHAERHMYHIIAGLRCRDSLPPNLTNLALGEESVCVILGIFFEQWIERESRGGRQYFGINLINANSCDAGRPHNQRRALQSQMKINAASPGPLLRRWLLAPAASSTGRMLRTHEDVWCVPFQPPLDDILSRPPDVLTVSLMPLQLSVSKTHRISTSVNELV